MLENLSTEQKIEFTQMVMEMLDDWGVSHSDKLILLALPDSVKVRAVRKYYSGEPLPENTQVFERIDHLMGIADALRTSFPLNYQMAAFWLNRKNQRFNNQTPLEFMLQGGLNSVVAVRTHLDCAWDWNQDQTDSP
jgi:hypothetical protein